MVKRTATKTASKPAKVTKDTKKKPQTARKPARVDLFVAEYLKDLNGAKAAIRAGYSPASARQTACDLLAEPEVQAKVQAAMDARAKAVGIEANQVLERWWALANADARELIELHRGCCRYCWGKNHRFQRTQQEMASARAQNAADNRARAAKNEPTVPFDEQGGIGYNPKKDPHPECVECFGDGAERIVARDTRDLSPSAQLLYAGVKTTQHGLEIKMADRGNALVNVARHLGMFKDKVELTGKDGKPIQHEHSVASLLDEIDGAGTGLPDHAPSE